MFICTRNGNKREAYGKNFYSVALCTYNGEEYISQQINSIIEQTIKPSEIIISDDGSTDNTIEIARGILENSNLNYKIINNDREKGVVANFENAISNCKYEYIFTSDQDDVWVENKAEIILNVFEKEASALLVFSDGELVDEKLKYLHCNMWKSVGINKKMLKEKEWCYK